MSLSKEEVIRARQKNKTVTSMNLFNKMRCHYHSRKLTDVERGIYARICAYGEYIPCTNSYQGSVQLFRFDKGKDTERDLQLHSDGRMFIYYSNHGIMKDNSTKVNPIMYKMLEIAFADNVANEARVKAREEQEAKIKAAKALETEQLLFLRHIPPVGRTGGGMLC